MKATTKERKRLYYNKLTNKLYIETKAKSCYFKDEDNVLITLNIIKKNLDSIYIDLSLFPAHIFKNYGELCNPFQNELVWVHNKNKNKKPFLAYAEDTIEVPNYYTTAEDGGGIKNTTFCLLLNKILSNGKLSKKHILIDISDQNICYTKPKENYKIVTTIKLI